MEQLHPVDRQRLKDFKGRAHMRDHRKRCCQPSWWMEMIDSDINKCCYCKSDFGESCRSQIWGFKCFYRYEREHMVRVHFCGECDPWNEWEWIGWVDVFGAHLPTQPQLRRILEYRRAERTGLRCQECKTPEEHSQGNFKKCSACQNARYCSKECQLANWPQHKNFCRAKQGDKKALKKVKCIPLTSIPECPPSSPPRQPNPNSPFRGCSDLTCDCWLSTPYRPTPLDQDPPICCRVGCERIVHPPYTITMSYYECPHSNGPRINWVNYCSDSCMKKVIN